MISVLDGRLLESDWVLGKKQQKLKIAQEAILGPQHNALPKAEKRLNAMSRLKTLKSWRLSGTCAK